MKPGYYFQKCAGEIYYLSGKDSGNKFYNCDADDPRWTIYGAEAWKNHKSSIFKFCENFNGWLRSSHDPTRYLESRKWSKFIASNDVEMV